jgi:hypothetical protein
MPIISKSKKDATEPECGGELTISLNRNHAGDDKLPGPGETAYPVQ